MHTGVFCATSTERVIDCANGLQGSVQFLKEAVQKKQDMIVTTASKSFVVIVVMTTILVTLTSTQAQFKKKQHYVWKPQGRFGKRLADLRSPTAIDLNHLFKQNRNIKDPHVDDVTLHTATALDLDDVITCLFSPSSGQYRCLRDDKEDKREDVPQNRRLV